MKTPTLADFTNLYSLSKTLKFELRPIGKTKEHIEAKGILSKDEQRAESYQQMKKVIDAFHKYFIEIALEHVTLSKLEAYADLYYSSVERKKEDNFKKEIEKIQEDLRKEIVKGFKSGEAGGIYSKIDKKELFTELLDKWVDAMADKLLVEEFKTFTTYFTGFHENRKNMYTDKEQSTAIAYRLIHENLPKFLDNVKIFNKVKEVANLHDKCHVLYAEIEAYLSIKSIDEAFEIEYFNHTLTQKQIDVYNLIIGGKTLEDGKTKIKGLNEYINLYNQKQDKKNRIPKLKLLYKQILSDRNSISFLPEAFDDDVDSTASQKVLDAINNYYRDNLLDFMPQDKATSENVLLKTKELLADLKSYDLSKVYIRNDKAITDISQALFGDWGVMKSALEYGFLQGIEIGKKGISKKQEAEKEKYLKQPYFSIAELESALFNYKSQNEALQHLNPDSTPVANYFNTHFKAKKQQEQDKEFDLIANIDAKYTCIKGLLNTPYPADKKLNQDKKIIDDIKAFLDSLMELLHFVKPLALPINSTLEKDENFYSHFETYYEQLQLVVTLYNKVRNFATQKAYSVQKYKLNFDNSTLLDGWDVNKEEANSSILFVKDGLYFLGIMDKNHNKIFREIPSAKTQTTYAKVNYKLLPGASKMLPKVFFSNKNISFYNPDDEILRIRNHGTHTKGGEPQDGYDKLDFNVNDCRKMIDFFKSSINKHPEWSNFGFKFADTANYDSINDFYAEVEAQGYSISYTNIDEQHINQLVEEGKLYMFQIYNKDFSEYSKGKPNMHTLYWKALFDPENLKNVVYKLNGQAEVFYRKKSIDRLTIHKANEPIANKNPNATKKQSVFNYDLTKNKRYTVDKFQFHVPITINFKAQGNDYINNSVLDFLKHHPDVNIIGIDRGERHLIYLTLINQKGQILKQESLNTIVDDLHKIETPYHILLQNKEDERAKARENWGVIENIKELKEGYISQVVHKIAKMMVEDNAIVVMEDLNFGFKRGRFKVEKQVYQKLEKMLIDKLNYLVFKDKFPHEIGGIYNALQLTNKFKSFKEMGKQSGFLFYVPAWNTSKIDPTTGFVNLFDTKYESVEKAQAFFDGFKRITFNATKMYFEFEVDDYSKFNAKAAGTRLNWVICTYGKRIRTFRNAEKLNQWDNEEINLTQAFEDFLGKYQLVYGNGNCIKSQIVSNNDKAFLKGLLDLFKLTLQMRNSITNSQVDYLISPVQNNKGEFYDSRTADNTLPKDADANGAYHIAKKGLMWLNQIQHFNGQDWKKLDLDKTNNGWLKFVQNNQ